MSSRALCAVMRIAVTFRIWITNLESSCVSAGQAARPLYMVRYSNPHSAMAAAYLNEDYTLKAIAEYFYVHYSTVSRAAVKNERQK